MTGTFMVDEVLKGTPGLTWIDLEFVQPDEPIGYRGVAAATFGVFFLQREGSRYRFVNPRYPFVRAIPGIRTTAQAPLDRVIELIAAVVNSDFASRAQKQRAAQILWKNTNPFAIGGLRTALGDSDREVALAAAAVLLAVGDLDALTLAEETLTRSSVGVSDEVIGGLISGITLGVFEADAGPSLERLSQVDTPRLRRAAVSALRFMRPATKVDALVRALDDSDEEVRHLAVVALAEITGDLKRLPSRAGFRRDEQRHLQFWREWARLP